MQRPFVSRLWLFLVFSLAGNPAVLAAEQALESEQAFELSAALQDAETVRLSWNIADGYYLYRQKFKFVSLTAGIKTGDPVFPVGQLKQDHHFGTVELYRNDLEVKLPIARQQGAQSKTLTLEVTFQGCADAGICYMPTQKVISFELPDLTVRMSPS